MKNDSLLARIYASVFIVVFFALLGGGFLAVESTGYLSLRRGPITDPRVSDTSDYRPRAIAAFKTGAVIGGILGILIQFWRPRNPVRYDD